MLENESGAAAEFLHHAIVELAGCSNARAATVLDVGCGTGDLVHALAAFGYDTYGCDVGRYWSAVDEAGGHLRVIAGEPYRLPFDDGTFDVVLSTSVLEHAQNKEELFAEILRVLKSGGTSMHLYPGKWYLPSEPHIYVPLVNVFWPYCPSWWLAFWARVGRRNEFQVGRPWREVVAANRAYIASGLSYWSGRRYRRLSLDVFGNYADRTDFFLAHGYGGLARIARRLPLKRIVAMAAARFRMAFMVHRKDKAPTGRSSRATGTTTGGQGRP